MVDICFIISQRNTDTQTKLFLIMWITSFVGVYKGYRHLKDWLDVDKKVMRDVANLDSILSDIYDKQKVITLQAIAWCCLMWGRN